MAMVFAAATKLSDGTTTSSPGPHPAARSARWRAAVPFATAYAYFAPQKLAELALEVCNFCPHAPPARPYDFERGVLDLRTDQHV